MSAVHISTILGFLRKNQRPSDPHKTLVIPALRPLLSPELKRDISLCPVRALFNYLERTREFRRGRERLFVSFKPGFQSEISSQTIFTWIRTCIQECYRLAQEAKSDIWPLAKAKAHEVRTLSSSWAFFNGLSLDSILQAANWRIPLVFTNHYLRAVSYTHLTLPTKA